ncbi:hypothetical protein [Aureispira sp. CCB-QB1]|uniref:hypothetical protein n=1 Tax=Aureispira sp. CCB-QB1 TaxID=1313421 RepID=UPI0006967C16|nr:hypothetical protein [Aureispira sp. CCB-QB1]
MRISKESNMVPSILSIICWLCNQELFPSSNKLDLNTIYIAKNKDISQKVLPNGSTFIFKLVGTKGEV